MRTPLNGTTGCEPRWSFESNAKRNAGSVVGQQCVRWRARRYPSAIGTIVGGVTLAGLAAALGLLGDMDYSGRMTVIAIALSALGALGGASLVPKGSQGLLILNEPERQTALHEFRERRKSGAISEDRSPDTPHDGLYASKRCATPAPRGPSKVRGAGGGGCAPRPSTADACHVSADMQRLSDARCPSQDNPADQVRSHARPAHAGRPSAGRRACSGSSLRRATIGPGTARTWCATAHARWSAVQHWTSSPAQADSPYSSRMSSTRGSLGGSSSARGTTRSARHTVRVAADGPNKAPSHLLRWAVWPRRGSARHSRGGSKRAWPAGGPGRAET